MVEGIDTSGGRGLYDPEPHGEPAKVFNERERPRSQSQGKSAAMTRQSLRIAVWPWASPTIGTEAGGVRVVSLGSGVLLSASGNLMALAP